MGARSGDRRAGEATGPGREPQQRTPWDSAGMREWTVSVSQRPKQGAPVSGCSQKPGPCPISCDLPPRKFGKSHTARGAGDGGQGQSPRMEQECKHLTGPRLLGPSHTTTVLEPHSGWQVARAECPEAAARTPSSPWSAVGREQPWETPSPRACKPGSPCVWGQMQVFSLSSTTATTAAQTPVPRLRLTGSLHCRNPRSQTSAPCKNLRVQSGGAHTACLRDLSITCIPATGPPFRSSHRASQVPPAGQLKRPFLEGLPRPTREHPPVDFHPGHSLSETISSVYRLFCLYL